MADFLAASAAAILLFVAIGLYRLLRGPSRIDRVAAMQLVGSGGTAALALLSVAQQDRSLVDLALVLALLATFASAAATLAISRPGVVSVKREKS